jgi:pimeloyl-ACP methyl ester carboxylesterase
VTAPDAFTPLWRGGEGSPLVLLHGFTDTWRTWELLLDELSARHEVLAVTLPGHAGGPPLPEPLTDASLEDELERMLDAAGVETAHLAGNSLGGYLALRLAARGRARSVVALAPAGGAAPEDPAPLQTLRYFATMHDLVTAAAPRADEIVASLEGRRRATQAITVNFEHIPPELCAHLIRGAAGCAGLHPLIEHATRVGWSVDASQITCPVRIAWGTRDQILPWPAAAAAYRSGRLAGADWVTLDGVGHCPQLDAPGETAQLILDHTARATAGRISPAAP